jgi:ABC-type sugar transport system substrate-binding protein
MRRNVLALLAPLAAALASCSDGSPGPGTLRIGMMPKLVGIPYFNACERGAREAARELGVELVWDGPDTADSNRQVEIVNSWVLRGFDAIAVAPNNPEAIAPVLESARQRGIRVLTWDTDSIAAARECFCNQVDARELARTLVDIVAGELGGKGVVALISGTETAANQNTWMALMREYMAERYPEMSILDPIEYPGEDAARAYQSASGLLRRPDRPGALVGMTSVSAPAAAKAVDDAGLSGKVAVTGVALPSAMRRYVEGGTVKRFALWNPVDLGYLTVHAARRLHEQGTIAGETLAAGRLGELRIRGREVLLGPPLVFDAGNIGAHEY